MRTSMVTWRNIVRTCLSWAMMNAPPIELGLLSMINNWCLTGGGNIDVYLPQKWIDDEGSLNFAQEGKDEAQAEEGAQMLIESKRGEGDTVEEKPPGWKARCHCQRKA